MMQNCMLKVRDAQHVFFKIANFRSVCLRQRELSMVEYNSVSEIHKKESGLRLSTCFPLL